MGERESDDVDESDSMHYELAFESNGRVTTVVFELPMQLAVRLDWWMRGNARPIAIV